LATTHLVVDGSNIATEGRSLPSLQQLLEAVDAISKEYGQATVTVIVDATFGHRIDASERPAYEDKVNSGQIITPPAGVIGRGDAFILEVADRADAIVLSNDSFQEFHGTYDWLFQEGRLLGGKHVPGVGWIFLARSPVRGPTSRRAVSDAKRKRRGSKQAASTKPATKKASKAAKSSKSSSRSRSKSSSRSTDRDDASKAAADAPAGRKRGGKEPEPYNEPLPFIEFVGAHPVGSVIEAEVEQFASHGAYVVCDGTRCYISLKSISDPPPRSAREVLTLGETHEFVVKAIDTPRRGIDLAMPGMSLDDDDDEDVTEGEVDVVDEGVDAAPASAEVTREPTETTAAAPSAEPAAVIDEEGERKLSVSQRRKLRAQQQAEAAAHAAAEEREEATAMAAATRSRARSAKKAAPAKKAATQRKAASEMATKKSSTKKAASKKKAPAKKATAKKAAAKKSTAKKAAAKKSTAKKAAAKKSTAKKAAAKKSTAKKAAAKKSTAKKAGAKKSTAKKAAAKKSTARKAATKRA
jgi:hypothetical protein